MTRAEIIQAVIAYAGEDYDAATQAGLVATLVDDATAEVARALCPWASTEDDVTAHESTALAAYGRVIVKIAEYHYDKTGKDGATGWSENGASMQYDAPGTPPSYLAGVIPISQIL